MLRVLTSCADVSAEAWDALVHPDDPFGLHAFHLALEASRSVGPGTGWGPAHLAMELDGALVGLVPLYVKTHSYGEYIFDFAWAQASQRLRAPYYPKLVAMAPFTPTTAPRIGVASSLDADAAARVRGALLEGLLAHAEATRSSSVHLLFVPAAEAEAVAEDPRWMRRSSLQFQFENPGYRDFRDLLDAFRSPARKQVLRERRAVTEAGLVVRTLGGGELSPDDVRFVHDLYADTCARKGGTPYLTPAFFPFLRTTLAPYARVTFAYEGEVPVAMSLAFVRGRVLYGRYWGAVAAFDRLHFELCYYALLERTLEEKLVRFEAGAQGEHKIKRGFLPTEIHSVHHVRNPLLCAAVAEFLPREREAVLRAADELARETPFRRG